MKKIYAKHKKDRSINQEKKEQKEHEMFVFSSSIILFKYN